MAADKEIRINLIEKDHEVFSRRKNIVIGLFIVLFMLSGIIYSYCYTRAELKAVQDENGRLKDEYARAELLLQDLEENKSSSDLLEEKMNSVLYIQKSQTSTLEILNEIEKNLPPDIELSEIEVRVDKVTLKGFAPAHTPEALLLSSLGNSELFADVIMISSNMNEKAGAVLFEVEVAREEGE